MTLNIVDMTPEAAREILSWRYPDDYAMYDIVVDNIEEEVEFFMNPDNHYYAIVDANSVVVGHCVFYAEARVPGGDYHLEALDIGIGMRPDWTGQGKGRDITKTVMDFGRKQYKPTHFRATVAAWNERAQKVCTNNGFEEVSRFSATNTGKAFVIFVREA
jgi:ribosomal-protein-alanine N-acetyltransferase